MHFQGIARLLPINYLNPSNMPHRLLLEHDPHPKRRPWKSLLRKDTRPPQLARCNYLVPFFHHLLLPNLFSDPIPGLLENPLPLSWRRQRHDRHFSDLHLHAASHYSTFSHLHVHLAVSQVWLTDIIEWKEYPNVGRNNMGDAQGLIDYCGLWHIWSCVDVMCIYY